VAGTGYELTVIASVAIGGAGLSGGRDLRFVCIQQTARDDRIATDVDLP
jgi:hypothetical protein